MGDKLRPKYLLYRIVEDEGGRPPMDAIELSGYTIHNVPFPSTDPEDTSSPFVLMPKKDPAAFRALICYANFCETKLKDEIGRFLNLIAESEPELGTQGARNLKEILKKELGLGLQE